VLLSVNYETNFAKLFKTIIADNGSEFSELNTSVFREGTEVFFAHPYTSCERGTDEDHNGLIHRFIPKWKTITSVSEDTIRYAEN